MLRLVTTTLTTVLVLSVVSCSNEPAKNTNVPATGAANTNQPAAPTSAPAASAPASTAPTTATVKTAAGNKWKDDASGTAVTTIKVGGTVTFTNTGGNHSLARVAGSADNGCGNLEDSFDSDLDDGASVTRTFTKEGTFGYICGVHKGKPNCKTPPGTGMSGVIKVVP